MADAPHDFDEEFDLANKEGVSFVLGGHTFTTKGSLHPKAFLNKDRGLEFAIGLIRVALIPEDREVFDAMIEDPDILLSAKQVDSVGSWLVEVYSDRPTESPAKSGAGRGTRSGSSKVAALSKAKTGSG